MAGQGVEGRGNGDRRIDAPDATVAASHGICLDPREGIQFTLVGRPV